DILQPPPGDRALANAIQGHTVSPEDRRAAIAALSTVREFVEGLEGVDEMRKQQLVRPLIVLDAVLRGTPPPPVGGRPPDPAGRERMRGAAAAVMSMLIDVGFGRKEAAKLVAKELGRGGVVLRGRRGDWSTVAAWRDQMNKAPTQEAVEAYCRCMGK